MDAKDIDAVSSLEDLQGVAQTLERETLRRYAFLAELMRHGHNTETAVAFEDLATRPRHFKDDGNAMKQSNDTLAEDANEPGAEIADTPYLMTPYQALRLAVYNEEQAFDLFSRIAADTEDPALREQAEHLARNQIQFIAELRLQRRRAFRAQAETTVGRVGRDRLPKTPGDVYETRHEIEAVIRELIEKEFHDLRGKLPMEAASTLDRVIQDIGMQDKGYGIEHLGTARNDKSDPQRAFLALRSLLWEIEAAFEVFMAFVETGPSEDIVNAAEETAERYVRLLALIRACLDDLVDA